MKRIILPAILLSLGAQAAAQQAETQPLIRQDFIAQMDAEFARLDADGNGALSPQEFAVLVNTDAVPVDAAPLMTQFDTDRDQVITLVEYRVATQANFDRIDTDRDGVVTGMEMRAAGIVQ